MRNIVLEGRKLVVLGKGLSGDPQKDEELGVSIHSLLNVIAAGLLYRHAKVTMIIFTGGRTAGKQHISEAEAMKKELHKLFPEIPDEHVLVETESIDTLGNITELLSRKLLQRNMSIPVLSLDQHLRRSKILFRNIAGINAETVSAQEVIEQYGSPAAKLILKEFNHSNAALWETIKELILNVVVIFDPKGKRLRKITAAQRHGNEN